MAWIEYYVQNYNEDGRASAMPPKGKSLVFSNLGTRKGKNCSGTIRFDVFILVLKFHTVSFNFQYCGLYCKYLRNVPARLYALNISHQPGRMSFVDLVRRKVEKMT